MHWLFFLALLIKSDTFYENYEEGLAHLEDQRYEKAIESLEEAIAINPESGNNKRTYGVQMIAYYPHTYLAEAYLLTKQFDKARRSLQNAYFYKEQEARDKTIQNQIAFIENAIRAFDIPDTENNDDARFTIIMNLINNDHYKEARDQLLELMAEHPEDQRLGGIATLLEDLLSKKQDLLNTQEQLNSTQQVIEKKIQKALEDARRFEGNDELDPAFQNYFLAKSLDPKSREAQAGIDRIRGKLRQKGIANIEIEDRMEQAQRHNEELIRENNKMLRQVSTLEGNLKTLSKEHQDLKKQTSKPKGHVVPSWDVPVHPELTLTASISATLTSTVGMKQATLYINETKAAEWDLKGLMRYRLPPVMDYTFSKPSNSLMLNIMDIRGENHSLSYSLNFPKSSVSRPILPRLLKIIAAVGLFLSLVWFFVRTRKRRQAFRNRFNPYIAGAPILNEDMFYGRKPLLRQILNTIHNNSLMICGERRIGKTSFLHQLHAELPKIEDPDYEFIPVFMDLQGVKESEFFSVLDHEIGLALADKNFHFTPANDEIDARRFTQRLRQYVNHLKQQCKKAPKLVLLLDEVDVMNSFSEQTNQQLRSVFMKGFARHLVAIMAGIQISTRWKSEGSPWYNFFEQVELRPFSRNQARSLIVDPVKGIYTYEKDAVNLIIELTEQKPYLIQKICVNLVARIVTENRRKILQSDVQYVFNGIKGEVSGAD